MKVEDILYDYYNRRCLLFEETRGINIPHLHMRANEELFKHKCSMLLNQTMQEIHKAVMECLPNRTQCELCDTPYTDCTCLTRNNMIDKIEIALNKLFEAEK